MTNEELEDGEGDMVGKEVERKQEEKGQDEGSQRGQEWQAMKSGK